MCPLPCPISVRYYLPPFLHQHCKTELKACTLQYPFCNSILFCNLKKTSENSKDGSTSGSVGNLVKTGSGGPSSEGVDEPECWIFCCCGVSRTYQWAAYNTTPSLHMMWRWWLINAMRVAVSTTYRLCLRSRRRQATSSRQRFVALPSATVHTEFLPSREPRCSAVYRQKECCRIPRCRWLTAPSVQSVGCVTKKISHEFESIMKLNSATANWFSLAPMAVFATFSLRLSATRHSWNVSSVGNPRHIFRCFLHLFSELQLLPAATFFYGNFNHLFRSVFLRKNRSGQV